MNKFVAWLETPVANEFQDASPEFAAALSCKLVAEARPASAASE